MTDIEKVIKGLEDSLTNQGCGFMDGVGELYAVSGEDLQNAIALLKEQQSVIECLKGKIKRYEFEKGWDECPDRMNGGGWT